MTTQTFHEAAMAQTSGLCGYCQAVVDTATGVAATSGTHEGWTAYCSQDHYEAHRGQPIATQLLWKEGPTDG